VIFSLPLLLTAHENEPVVIQMQWKHQFEYAGFYAAIEKGFYRDAGLEVSLREYEPGMDITEEVLSGRAEYGLHYSSLLAEYLSGKPVVMLANIFKHPALVLVAQPDIIVPSDLKGKRVMANEQEILSSPIAGMLSEFNIHPEDLRLVKPSFNLEDFTEKRVDAMTVFITNEIHELNRHKVRYTILNPSSYNSQFYDVNLFTSKQEVEAHHERVDAMTEATLKGWEYALEHPEEIIDLILKKYNSQHKSREALEFEARMTRQLILPELYPLGSIDEKILRSMAKNYEALGLAAPNGMHNYADFVHRTDNRAVHLSINEHRHLEEKGKLTLCVDPEWMPYEKLENGRHIGIIADLFGLIQAQLQIPIEVVPSRSWSESLALAKSRKCDIVSMLMATPERSAFLDFTQPFFTVPSVIATRTEQLFINEIEEILDRPLGIVRGYADVELLRLRYPAIHITEVENLRQGLDKVVSGELFGMIDALHPLAYLIQREYAGELKISGKLEDRQAHAIGVRKDDPLLLNIMNKALASIPESRRQEAVNRWVSVTYDKGFDYSLLWKILAVVLALGALLLHRQWTLSRYNQSLKADVARQVEELRKKDDVMLRNAQMAVMGEMIGIIAHQMKQPVTSLSLNIQDVGEAYDHGELNKTYIQSFIARAMTQIDFMTHTIEELRNYFRPGKNRKSFDLKQLVEKSTLLLEKQYAKHGIALHTDCDACTVSGIETELMQVVLNIANNAKEALVSKAVPAPRITVACRSNPATQSAVVTIEDNAGGIDPAIMGRIFDSYFSTKGEEGTGIGLYMSKKIIEESFGGTITAVNGKEGARFVITLRAACPIPE